MIRPVRRDSEHGVSKSLEYSSHGRHMLRALIAVLAVVSCLVSVAVAMPLHASADEDVPSTISDDQIHQLDGDDVLTTTIQYQGTQKDASGNTIYGDWTDLQPDSDGNYHFDAYNNPDWRYRISASYHLEKGTLREGQNYLEYSIPKGLRILENATGPAVDSSGDRVGTYTLTTDGLMIIKLDDDVVAGNADHPLKGDLRFDVQVSEDGAKNGGEIVLPGNKTRIDIGKKYDLHLTKTAGKTNRRDQTVPFTITVSSEYGTNGNIRLSDYVKDGTILGGATGVTVRDGKTNSVVLPSIADCGSLGSETAHDGVSKSLDLCLPALEADGFYTITYTTKGTAQEGTVSNTAVATSKDGNNNELKAEGWAQGDWTSTKPTINKTAGGFDDNGNVKWTVTLNQDGVDLGDWTLRDLPGANVDAPQNVSIAIRDDNGNVGTAKPTDLPITFSKGDTHTYVITYTTPVKGFETGYSNTAMACKSNVDIKKYDDLQSHSSDCVWNDAYQGVNNPLYKTGVGTPVASDNQYGSKTTTLQWKTTINADSWSAADIPAGWTYTDELQNTDKQYFTPAQKASIAIAVRAAFLKAGIAEPTVTFYDAYGKEVGASDNSNAVKFTITSPAALPKDKSISFEYSSTGNIGDGTTQIGFGNNSSIGGFTGNAWTQYNPPSEPSNPSEPTKVKSSLVKYDGTESDDVSHAASTSHDYKDLKTLSDGTKYVDWGIAFTPGDDMLDEFSKAIVSGSKKDFVIKDRLPDGLHLLGADAKDANGNAVAPLVLYSQFFWAAGTGNPKDFVWSQKDQAYEATYSEWDPTAGQWGENVTKVIATATVRNNVVTITIPAETIAWWRTQGLGNVSAGAWREAFRFRVRAAFDSDQFASYQEVHTYANGVTALYGDDKVDDSQQSQTIVRDDYNGVIGKQNTNKINNSASYELNINPQSMCVGSKKIPAKNETCKPETYSFSDVAKYQHIDGYGNAILTVDPASVKLYTTDLNKSKGELTSIKPVTGTEKYQTSTGQTDVRPVYGEETQVRELTKDEYKLVVESNHPQTYNGEWSEKLTFTVPNQAHLIIRYTYKVQGEHSDTDKDSHTTTNPWIGIKNEATLMGRTATPDDTNVAVNLQKAAASIDGFHLTVYKVDSTNNARGLAGAKFNLLTWTPGKKGTDVGTFEPVKDPSNPSKKLVLTSDKDGKVSISQSDYAQLTYNHAYALQEVTAPGGYLLDSQPHYFMIRFSNTDKYPVSAPDDFDASAVYGSESVAPDGIMYFADTPKPKSLPLTGVLGGTRWIVLGGAVLAVIAGAFAMDARRSSRRRFC